MSQQHVMIIQKTFQFWNAAVVATIRHYGISNQAQNVTNM